MKFLLRSFGTLMLLTGTLLPATAQTSLGTFATNSKLAQGRWVKVAVTRSGIHSISFDQLRQWGFSSPEQVRVYGFSGLEHESRLSTPAPDDLPLVQSITSNDKLIFYGEGPERVLVSRVPQPDNWGEQWGGDPDPYQDEENPDKPQDTIPAPQIPPFPESYNQYWYKNPASDRTIYFLTEQSGANPAPVVAETGLGTGDTVRCFPYVQRQLFEQYSKQPGGAIFYSRPMQPGEVREVAFDMPGYASDAYFSFQMAGLSDANALAATIELPPTVRALSSDKNANAIMDRAGEYYMFLLSTEGRQAFEPVGDAKRHTFKIVASETQMDMVCAYQASLWYKRKTQLGTQAQMAMNITELSDNPRLEISQAPSDMMLWDVTQPTHVKAYPLNDEDGVKVANLNASKPRKLVAFSPSRTLMEPEYLGEAENHSLHSLPTPEMVIISTKTCLPQAQRLAQLHHDSYQKMDVQVVEQQQVFDEFSSGTPHPEAFRKFLQMLWLRDPKKLRYAILFGEGTYDNRQVVTNEGRDYMLTYQTDSVTFARNETMAYASDMYFGFLNPAREVGASGKLPTDPVKVQTQASIAVARISAASDIEARGYVDKVETFLSDPTRAGDMTQVMCLGDCADKNKHVLDGVEQDGMFITEKFPGTTSYKIYQELQDYYSTNDLSPMTEEFSWGVSHPVGYITYSGHAKENALGKRLFLTQAMEQHMSYASMPVMFVGACKPLSFDNPVPTILTQMVMQPRQGPIACVGPHRTAFMTPNQTYEHAICESLYSCDPKTERLGDGYLKAFNLMMSKSITSRINTMCYSLVGDPALPLYLPEYQAVMDKAQKPADDNGTFDLFPASETMLSGRILDSNGKPSNFTGLVDIRLYDQPYKKMLNELYPDDVGYSTGITVDHSCIATATGTATNGQWEALLTLPAIAVQDDTPNLYRLTLTARTLSPDGSYMLTRPEFATGRAYARMDTTGYGTNPSGDTKAPEITELYVNNPQINGQEISGDGVTVYATVTDEGSGLNIASFGGTPRLSLDGVILSNTANRFTSASDRTWTLTLPLSKVSDGEHTLQLMVADCAGNKAEKTITFTVDNAPGTARLTADQPIVRDQVVLSLEHTLPTSNLSSILLITDSYGKTWMNKPDRTYPTSIDVTHLPDGQYKAQVMLRTPSGYMASEPAQFTVFKRKN